MNLSSKCPVCDGQITLSADTQETEIISCSECQNRVVVTSLANNQVVLEEAPEIEEDWGE